MTSTMKKSTPAKKITSGRSAQPARPARGPRLARTRYSCRLPVALASRLEALCEMHHEKTRAQLMGDLIGLGLAEVERVAAGAVAAVASFHPDTRQAIYLLTGPFAEFHGLTSKHHLAMERDCMEREHTQDDVDEMAPVDDYSLGDME